MLAARNSSLLQVHVPFAQVQDPASLCVRLRAALISALHKHLHARALAVLEGHAPDGRLPIQASKSDKSCRDCKQPMARSTRAHLDVLAMTHGFEYAHEAFMDLVVAPGQLEAVR